MTKFEPREIDLVHWLFGKVDAGESHAHVFVGWIAPPCVPGVLALGREGKKVRLIVCLFFGGRIVARCSLVFVRHAWCSGRYKISGKSLLLKIAASFLPCFAKFCAAPSS
ncbi:MAG: hypothetical protein ACREDD_12245 [Methylocella sp.]